MSERHRGSGQWRGTGSGLYFQHPQVAREGCNNARTRRRGDKSELERGHCLRDIISLPITCSAVSSMWHNFASCDLRVKSMVLRYRQKPNRYNRAESIRRVARRWQWLR